MTRKIAAFAASAVVALGLAMPAAYADSSSAPPPAVTSADGAYTVSLPGVGSLTFTVDPATGAIANVVATADASGTFTAGAPTVTTEGVQVVFTDASGATQVLKVEVKREDGAVTVKAESESDQPDNETEGDQAEGDHHGSDAGVSSSVSSSTSVTEPSDSVESEGDHGGTTPTTEAESEHSGGTTSTTEAESEHSGGTTSTTEAEAESSTTTSTTEQSGGSGSGSGSGGGDN